MAEQKKDHLFTFRSTMKDQDSKGRDRIRLYLDQEQVQIMIDILSANLENEKGVKFSFHTGEKESDQGRSFLSTFGFVSAVAEFGAGGGKSDKKKTFVKKAAASALGQTVKG
jgi:hypothetical protein